ncbi:MAG: YtxH domain-containing protein [Bacteroidota bacterium]
MNAGKLFLGVLVGVAVGATLGILFAPEKGTVLRRKISRKGEDITDDLEERFYDFIDTTAKKCQDVKDEATSMVDNGKKRVNEFVDELK